MEEEDEGCINVIQCNGMNDAAGGRKMPGESWLKMKEADEVEVRPPSLTDEEEFQA
jgi:hypothetical protein